MILKEIVEYIIKDKGSCHIIGINCHDCVLHNICTHYWDDNSNDILSIKELRYKLALRLRDNDYDLLAILFEDML